MTTASSIKKLVTNFQLPNMWHTLHSSESPESAHELGDCEEIDEAVCALEQMDTRSLNFAVENGGVLGMQSLSFDRRKKIGRLSIADQLGETHGLMSSSSGLCTSPTLNTNTTTRRSIGSGFGFSRTPSNSCSLTNSKYGSLLPYCTEPKSEEAAAAGTWGNWRSDSAQDGTCSDVDDLMKQYKRRVECFAQSSEFPISWRI